MRSIRPTFCLAALWLAGLLATSAAQAQDAPPAASAAAASAPITARSGEGQRPRIGLVLSGGGARGLAHVGVLKVLEQARVPIDVIAGTSMGAIIGGLYASGMPAQEIETELLKVDWRKLFATRVSRQQLSQRRKEEDFEIANGIELGYRDGAFRAPQGAVSSRGLESLLRRYTLPVRTIEQFDRLPTPFRAVATNMETGDAVVMDHGDLAMALRSSMSVPGVFPSTDIDGQVLGDGGLVNNVPIDVARQMGADIVIVVNIGTPLAGRDTLNSALGLTAQMINILTEQNVRRSLATLGARDILIAPELGALSSGDFEKTAQLIQLGQQGAEQQTQRLASLALSPTSYAGWQLARRPAQPLAPELSFVRFEGSQDTSPARWRDQLKSRVGQAFDAVTAALDATTLAASDDYVRVDYRLQSTPDGDGLVFELEDKPWGPNYLRVGLDLSTNFSASSAFNIKLSHNRHWLGDAGTEWRNWVQIGETPTLYTELYHPLSWNLGLASDWFVAGSAGVQRRAQTLYLDGSSSELGQVRRTESRFNVDLGRPWANLGELRLGLQTTLGRSSPVLLSSAYTGPTNSQTWTETAARARVAIDQLDFANFPQNGYRVNAELQFGRRAEGVTSNLYRLETDGLMVFTRGRHTFSVSGLLKAADARADGLSSQYQLGGFQQMSGYLPGQLAGNAVLLGRLGWYMRLTDAPVFARGFFFGGTLEAGNAWADRRELGLTGLRTGASVYLGADTGIGPMYLGLTWAPKGQAGLALFIGRP